jgi:metallophosphoesterase (TIGR00282 family)
MNILCIGDVVAKVGCEFLRDNLAKLKKNKNIDMVIANGENSADGNGITPYSANHLFDSGVDLITTGNHAFRRKESHSFYDKTPHLIRPLNYPEGTFGKGYCIYDTGKFGIAVISLMGTVYLESLTSPFEVMENLLKKINTKFIIVDFHAEATAEKRALAFFLDGKISAIFGTHTHVQTSDETILPKGTGYITDVGMTGVIDSVLGVKKENAIYRMKTKLPIRFDQALGACKMDCILFNIDNGTGKTNSLERIEIV